MAVYLHKENCLWCQWSLISTPKVELTNYWQVDGQHVERMPIISHNDTLLFSSQSSLNITLNKEHFTVDGKIEISCVASIGSLQTVTHTGSASDTGLWIPLQSIVTLEMNLTSFRGHSLILNGLQKLCFELQSRISLQTF